MDIATAAVAPAPTRIIKIKEMCRLLGGITPETLRKWVLNKTFPEPIRYPGGRKAIGWPQTTYDEWVAQQQNNK